MLVIGHKERAHFLKVQQPEGERQIFNVERVDFVAEIARILVMHIEYHRANVFGFGTQSLNEGPNSKGLSGSGISHHKQVLRKQIVQLQPRGNARILKEIADLYCRGPNLSVDARELRAACPSNGISNCWIPRDSGSKFQGIFRFVGYDLAAQSEFKKCQLINHVMRRRHRRAHA